MIEAIPPDVLERVRARLVRSGLEPTAAHVAEALRDEGLVLGDAVLMRLVLAVRSELSGAGPLEPLLRDDAVSDVLVNGPDSVWVDRGAGLERVAVSLTDEAAVRRLAQRLAALAGRRLDEAAPYVDARLPDGSRLHAVIPPVAPRGTCISIRVPRRRTFTLAELARGLATCRGSAVAARPGRRSGRVSVSGVPEPARRPAQLSTLASPS
jgi:pilus assembly protein CpaF